MTTNFNETQYCSFCNREITDEAVKGLKDTVYICNNCIDIIYNHIHNINNLETDVPENKNGNNTHNFIVRKPSEIKAYLDQYVIGQDKAKDILSVAIYNHYKTITSDNSDVEIQKSNILMLGSSGSGKTMLLQTLAKFLDVPFAIVDSSTLTAAGYVGADIETGLKSLIQAAGGDVEKAERGIIFLDEFDKLSRKGENVSITRDVGGEAVQQGLLKIIEGTIADVPQGSRRHPQEECIQINTKNILFVCGGSFEGIEKIINKRIHSNESNIGFGSDPQKKEKAKLGDVVDQVNTDDLRKFGLIPEIIGRLPIICTLQDLTEEALVKILKEPKNALCKQYAKLFKYDNVELTFDNEALREIANMAIKRNVGARGLKSIVENLLLKYMKIVPDSNIQKINITKDYVSGNNTEPEIFYLEKQIN